MRGRTARSPWVAFGLWLLAGAAVALGVLTMLSIGVVVLPVALVAIAVLARRPALRDGVVGVIAGLGIPLLYVAYLNRDGPGTVCTPIDGGFECADEWSPWPWAAAGLALVAIGAAWCWRATRLHR